MRIHTLGPKETDSYNAAKSLRGQNEIVTYNSFEEIFFKFKELKGDYILIPAAYENISKDYGWKDFNFQYWECLKLDIVFEKYTKPMLLIENSKFEIDKVIVHPATEIFIKLYLDKENKNCKIEFENSKYLAWEKFLRSKYRYTIISKDVFDKTDTNFEFKVLEEYEPIMVWCLYKIE